MVILFALMSLGILLFGYYIMSRIDAFLQHDSFIDNPNRQNEPVLLIYTTKKTDPLLATLLPRLYRQKVRFLIVFDPHVPFKANVYAVLAISGSDIDNLLLCREAKHRFAEVYTIARCHDPLYRHFFQEAGINRILTGDASDSLFTYLDALKPLDN